jgi:hypothetical protein
MELRDLPRCDSERDLVERFVPIAAVLAAVVAMLIIWC